MTPKEIYDYLIKRGYICRVVSLLSKDIFASWETTTIEKINIEKWCIEAKKGSFEIGVSNRGEPLKSIILNLKWDFFIDDESINHDDYALHVEHYFEEHDIPLEQLDYIEQTIVKKWMEKTEHILKLALIDIQGQKLKLEAPANAL